MGQEHVTRGSEGQRETKETGTVKQGFRRPSFCSRKPEGRHERAFVSRQLKPFLVPLVPSLPLREAKWEGAKREE